MTDTTYYNIKYTKFSAKRKGVEALIIQYNPGYNDHFYP
jgi:hypothetical protein